MAAGSLLWWATALAAQDGFHVAAAATVLASRAAPLPFDRTISEIRVVQPMLMTSFRSRYFAVSAMLDLEGGTMPGGQRRRVPGARDSTTSATRTPACTR